MIFFEETKQKLRLANIGKVGFNKGKSPSKETRDKIANTLKGRVGPNKGKPMSDEAKKKMARGKNRDEWIRYP